MVEKEQLDVLIWNLLRGLQLGFNVCAVIQEGVSYKKAIPKAFWNDEKKGRYGILGLHALCKSDMRKLHSEVVEIIINEINEPHHEREMYCDNYSRLFHALSILKVPKNDSRVPAIGKNYMYNIAYDLWALDDGSESTYNFISSAAWYASEAIKGSTTESLLTGRRHKIS